jgi:hypothetical protein
VADVPCGPSLVSPPPPPTMRIKKKIIEPEVSQELSNGPNAEPDESSSHIYHFFTINFNVFFPYIPRCSKRFIPSSLCVKIVCIIINGVSLVMLHL